MDGVWIAPVTAQVMMTLSSMSGPSARNVFCGAALVGGQRHQPSVAPGLAFLQLVRRQLLAPFGFDARQHRAAPLRMRQGIGSDLVVDRFITLDIVAHAAR